MNFEMNEDAFSALLLSDLQGDIDGVGCVKFQALQCTIVKACTVLEYGLCAQFKPFILSGEPAKKSAQSLKSLSLMHRRYVV